MKILGIDPGSIRTGYAVLDHNPGRTPQIVVAGTWSLGDRTALPERLARLSEFLDALLTEHTPDVLSLEESFVHHNMRTALVLGHARGVILAACARRGLAIAEYAPTSVKQAVAGNGRASKESVNEMVRRLLGLATLETGPDTSDALALALAWISLRPDPRLAAASLQNPVKTALPRGKSKATFDMDAYLKRIGHKL